MYKKWIQDYGYVYVCTAYETMCVSTSTYEKDFEFTPLGDFAALRVEGFQGSKG